MIISAVRNEKGSGIFVWFVRECDTFSGQLNTPSSVSKLSTDVESTQILEKTLLSIILLDLYLFYTIILK